MSEVSKLWAMYEDGLAYQSKMNMQTNIPRQVDFYEGRQWSDISNSKQLVKPVINIIKMIVRSKRASVLASPIKLEYQSSNNTDSAAKFTAFADYIAKEIKQEDLDTVAILDGAVKGTYCYHYYWSNEAQGLNGHVDGGLCGEIIDTMNLFVANPCEKDEQKQEWIIISSRMPLSAVKSITERGVADMDMIGGDDGENYYSEDTEPDNKELCTVLTRYFRIDGEVYFEKAVKGTMLHSPKPLNPYALPVNGQSQDEDPAKVAVPDIDQQPGNENEVKATLYPVAISSWDERNNCIYGVSEVESLMPNQKMINFLLALYCLAVQNVGWGKYIVKSDALKNQVITNEPGQILVDNSKSQGDGIKRMQEPPLSAAPINLVSTIMDMTRTVTGATEVMTGEQISSNMSGAAIAQLQIQAQKPIEEMRSRFWRVRERIGKIYEQFFKLFYEGKEYTYQGKDGGEVATFNGQEYATSLFTCVVEAGAGTQFSEPMTIANLERLLDKGIIDAKTFIKQYPRGAMPNREELLRSIEETEQGEMAQLQQSIQGMQAENEQLKAYIAENDKVYRAAVNVVGRNESLSRQVLELSDTLYRMQDEAERKISVANNEILKQNDMILRYANKLQGGGEVGL